MTTSTISRGSIAVVRKGCLRQATTRSLRCTFSSYFDSNSIATKSRESSNDKSNGGGGGSTSSMDQIKERLARSSLKQVESHGWTAKAIAAAAVQDLKLPLSMAGMLTPIELVHWFMNDMNRQLRDRMSERNSTATTTSTTTPVDHIFDAIQWRLQQVIPLVKCGQWHKGMALGLSTPLTTQGQLHEFIEIISPLHTSSEYQTALGGVFVATELHLLTDSSLDYQNTWNFLRNSLEELERNKDHPPSQLLSSVLSSSTRNFNPIDANIPIMASMAVASSLMEGVASLVFPNGRSNIPGTQPRDYEYHSSNDRSSNK